MADTRKFSKPRRYTKEYLTTFVNMSFSFSSLFKNLGIKSTGGNYKNIVGWIRYHGIDTTHFTSKAWARGLTADSNTVIRDNTKRKSLDDSIVFCENAPPSVSGSSLRKRVLKQCLIPYKCSECSLENNWNGKPITLDLDHINGTNNDNRIENLRFLCPNCHSQAPTSTSCKMRPKLPKEKKKYLKNLKKDICQVCKVNLKLTTSSCCRECFYYKTRFESFKIEWPSIEDLVKILSSTSYTSVAKKLGVSDNAIRKHLKKGGFDPKTLKQINNDPLCPIATDDLKG